jgi:hypothetical protein
MCAVASTCHPSYTGSTNRRIVVQTSLRIKQDPTSNITNVKRASGVAQVVECPPSKHEEALSSTTSTNSPKNKEKEKKCQLGPEIGYSV